MPKSFLKKGALWNAGIFLSTKESIIFHFLNMQKLCLTNA
jgi:hypothetical protein